MLALPNQRLYFQEVEALSNTPVNFLVPPIYELPTVTLAEKNATVATLADSLIDVDGKFSVIVPPTGIRPGNYSVSTTNKANSISVNYKAVAFSVNQKQLQFNVGLALNFALALSITSTLDPKLKLNFTQQLPLTVNHVLLAFTVGIPLTLRAAPTTQSLLGTNFKVKAVPNTKKVNLSKVTILDYNDQVTDMSSDYTSEVLVNNISTGISLPTNLMFFGETVVEFTHNTTNNKTKTVPFLAAPTSQLTIDNLPIVATVDNMPLSSAVSVTVPYTEHTNVNLEAQLPAQFETLSF